jgi:hypothetical protein
MKTLRKIEKTYLNKPEYKMDYTEWNPLLQFQLEEAACMVHREVIKRKDFACLPLPSIDKLGIIVGLLDINEEIELVIRWPDRLDQYSKLEFCDEFLLVPET